MIRIINRHSSILNKCIFILYLAVVQILFYQCSKSSQKISSAPEYKIDYPLNRFEQAVQGYEQQDSTQSFIHNPYLFIGSSSWVLWKNINSDLAPYPVLNRGYGGSTVPELQHYAHRMIYKYRPEAIIIYCGENDLSNKNIKTATQFFESFKQLISSIKLNVPGTRIAFVSMKFSPSRRTYWKEIKKGNQLVKEYAQKNKIDYLDINPYLFDAHGSPRPEVYTQDSLHVNELGYIEFTKLVRPYLAKISNGSKYIFNGKDHTGWYTDVPAMDTDKEIKTPFILRDDKMVSLAHSGGHIITNDEFENFRLELNYRFAAEPGNCGILVHASIPRRLYAMFPQSIEVQLMHKNAGDFWCIGEDIEVPAMETRRGPKENWGVDGKKQRRIINLTDGSEKPVGQWNHARVECFGNQIKVWINGDLTNHGYNATVRKGKIALQAEGSEVEFKNIKITTIKAIDTKN